MKTILICGIDQAFMSVTFRNTQTSLDVSEHHKNHLMITTIYIYYYSFGTYLQKIYYWPKQSTRMDKKASPFLHSSPIHLRVLFLLLLVCYWSPRCRA